MFLICCSLNTMKVSINQKSSGVQFLKSVPDCWRQTVLAHEVLHHCEQTSLNLVVTVLFG